MRIAVRAAVAVGLALTFVGYAQAAKRVHRSHEIHYSNGSEGRPAYHAYLGNPAAAGNNANSMTGSNSAAENAVGRTNCC